MILIEACRRGRVSRRCYSPVSSSADPPCSLPFHQVTSAVRNTA